MKITVAQRIANGRPQWCVDFKPPGQKRQRRFCRSRNAADIEAQTLRLHHECPESAWFRLTSIERYEVVCILDQMRAAGVSIRQAWDNYRASPNAEPRTLQSVIDEMLKAKEASRRSVRYIRHLRACLNHFTRAIDAERPIASITVREIETYIFRQGWKPRSSDTAKNRIRTLFSFARRRGYVASNPCESIEPITFDKHPPRILTIPECARALVHTRRHLPKLLPWLVLGLFGGLRPEEADQVTFAHIDFDRGTVRVDAMTSKVRQRRIVHLLPAALEWLRLAKASGGELPIARNTRRRSQRALRDRLRLKQWPADVLRHTAASNWLALWQDAGKVANELGNSAGILLSHYRELVYKDVAERFWALMPTARMLRQSLNHFPVQRHGRRILS